MRLFHPFWSEWVLKYIDLYVDTYIAWYVHTHTLAHMYVCWYASVNVYAHFGWIVIPTRRCNTLAILCSSDMSKRKQAIWHHMGTVGIKIVVWESTSCHSQESRSNLLAEHGKMFLFFADETEGVKKQRDVTTTFLPPRCLPRMQILHLV